MMATGMSTALTTTLVGLISSLHLKVQLVLWESPMQRDKRYPSTFGFIDLLFNMLVGSIHSLLLIY